MRLLPERGSRAVWRTLPLRSAQYYNTNGRVLRHAAAEDRHERPAGLSRECRSGARADTEIERRGDIRHAGEVNRLMLMGAGDVDEQLFGDGIRDRLIIARHGAIQRDG